MPASEFPALSAGCSAAASLVAAEEVDAVQELAVRLMPASLQMNVPLKVDLKRGRNWAEMK